MGEVEQLEKKLGADWTHLRAAREESTKMRAELKRAFQDLDSEDTSIVISGSLARDEFTPGSDLDWMLLVDGQADPNHHDLCLTAKRAIGDLVPEKPGTEQIFGSMVFRVFSHNLIHAIGGEEDTNLNLTRRAVLSLESQPAGRGDAYERVVRNILERYLLEDAGLWREGAEYRVPRFLQNDLARYWRTIAVDFAYKDRRRARVRLFETSNFGCPGN